MLELNWTGLRIVCWDLVLDGKVNLDKPIPLAMGWNKLE
jgi:hypothetical protein